MTEYEIQAVRKAVSHVLNNGGPNIADAIKSHMVESVARRLRQEFNVPSPPIRYATPGVNLDN